MTGELDKSPPQAGRVLPFPFLAYNSNGSYSLVLGEKAIRGCTFGDIRQCEQVFVLGILSQAGAQFHAKNHLGDPGMADIPVLTCNEIKAKLIEASGITLPFINNIVGAHFLATRWEVVNHIGRDYSGTPGDTSGAIELTGNIQEEAKRRLGLADDAPDVPIFRGDALRRAIEKVWEEPKLPRVKLKGAALTSWFRKLAGPNLFAQVSEFPQARDTRGLILSKFGCWPLPEITEEDWPEKGAGASSDIMAWVNENYDGESPCFEDLSSPDPAPTPPAPPATPAPPETEVAFNARWDEYESGRCRYSRTNCYESTIRIPLSDLIEMADEGQDAFERRLRQRLIEDASSEGGDCIDTVDDETHDHDSSQVDTDNYEFQGPNGRGLRNYIAQLVEEHPELRSALGEEEDA